MEKRYDGFLDSIENPNTKKVCKSLSKLGEYDYSDINPIKLDQIILDMKPSSVKNITTILYVLGMYARYLENDMFEMLVRDADRNALWLRAKPQAKRKFISHTEYNDVVKAIDTYEEYNSMYIGALFQLIYVGAYSDDLSTIKNLRSSDVKDNVITLREDNGDEYELEIPERLAGDLIKLGSTNTWQRRNRYGVCNIETQGLHPDSCFKVENRSGSKENKFRYSYYRLLRKVSKDHIGRSVLPLELYVSGIMYRIKANLNQHGITLEEAFEVNRKDRFVSKIIVNELERCNYDIPVRNFREMVVSHLDAFG